MQIIIVREITINKLPINKQKGLFGRVTLTLESVKPRSL